MIDHFSSNVHALLKATNGYGAMVPEPSDGRHIRRLAAWVAIQRDNPFEDHTLPQMLAIDFAEATLAWLDDPTSNPKVATFKQTRSDLLQSLQDDEPK